MADIFLMGTAGSSKWREPIKAACAEIGVSCFDPVVKDWNEEARRRETEALKTARVIVMAITSETAGIASLAESGWAALSALARRQGFGIFIDPVFGDEEQSQVNTGLTGFGGWILDTFFGSRDKEKQATPESVEQMSRRARKLAISHVTKLKSQFPDMNLYLAGSLNSLQTWAISTAQKMAAKAALAAQNPAISGNTGSYKLPTQH
jgi:hypothetical protein